MSRQQGYTASDGSRWEIDEPLCGEWCATHEEYDGPEDNRIFHAPTLNALIERIKEWVEEVDR